MPLNPKSTSGGEAAELIAERKAAPGKALNPARHPFKTLGELLCTAFPSSAED